MVIISILPHQKITMSLSDKISQLDVQLEAQLCKAKANKEAQVGC